MSYTLRAIVLIAIAAILSGRASGQGVVMQRNLSLEMAKTIAEGVIAASKAVGLKVPLVVRMKGTNEDLGRKILADSGLPIISANNMAEAAEKVVAAAKR